MRQRQSPRTKTHSTASTPTQFSPTPIASQQAQIDHLVVVYAGRLCNVLSRSGRKPFRLAGLRLYADLLALWDSLDTTLIHLLDEPRLICFADAIRQALLTFEDEYVDLAEGYSWVLDMAAILDAPLPQPPQLDPETQPGTTDPSSSSNPPHQTDATPAENCPVQAELDAYLLRLQARTDLSVILVAFRSHLIALTQRYASGLFPCYHIPWPAPHQQ